MTDARRRHGSRRLRDRRARRQPAPQRARATRCSPLLAFVPLLLTAPRPGRRRHQAVPLPRPRPAARAGARRCGTRTSGSARSPTRTSATCSRWARSTGSSTGVGVPDWVAQRLWLGTLLFAAGAGVLFLLPHARAARARARWSRALAYMLSPYSLALRGPHLGDPAAVGRRCRGCSRFTIRGAAPAAAGATRRCSRSSCRSSAASTRPRSSSPASARCSGSRTRSGSPARSTGAGRSRRVAADRRAHARARRCGGSPGCGRRAATASTSSATPRPSRRSPTHVARARGAARPRLLVLLRRRQARPLDRAERRLHAAASGSSSSASRSRCWRCCRRPCTRWRHRAYFVAPHARRRRRSPSAPTRTTTRRRSAALFKAFADGVDRRPRPAQHAARRAARRARRCAVLLGAGVAALVAWLDRRACTRTALGVVGRRRRAGRR